MELGQAYLCIGLGVFLTLYSLGVADSLSFGMTILQFIATLFLWPFELALQAYQTHKIRILSESMAQDFQKALEQTSEESLDPTPKDEE
jgi:hypothetical protein